MRRLILILAATAVIAAGCGSQDSSKYDRQYPQPTNEANMMRVLRTDKGPGPARSQPVGQERKESDTR